tara:strand:- start:350 stop:1783 length:1434 start_codon:yes stop_codon:yes gene_type:complete
MKILKFKISNFNKYLIFSISILFIYLFYLSIPTLYNKDLLQKELTEKILKEHNLNISLSSDITYLILPSPHILIKNAKIFNNDEKNPAELSQIKKLKVFISQKSLMKQKHMRITKLVISDANFIVQNKDIDFYKSFLGKKFSDKKIVVKNSNFFYKDKSDNTISIFNIPNLNLFYNIDKEENQINGNGESFQIPVDFKWSKNFIEKQVSNLKINFEKINLDLENIIIDENEKKLGKNILAVGNAKFFTDFSFQKNSIKFNSNNSKIVNSLIEYDGIINLKPFYIDLNLVLEKINLNKFILKNTILKEIIFSKILFDKNLSAKVNLKSENLKKNKLFDIVDLNFNINGGVIELNNSILENKKIGKLILENSSLGFENEELIFTGYFNFNIKNQKEFYRTFVVPKRNRKNLKNIEFNIEYNLNRNLMKIIDITLNDKPSKNVENIENIIRVYNNQDRVKIKNWIDLKGLVNKIFNNYFG